MLTSEETARTMIVAGLVGLASEGKLEATSIEGYRKRVLFRRADVERLRVERGVGRYGRT